MIESFGHYKILDRIGAGGLGDVYRARDTRRGRTVAIKVVAPAIAADLAQRERLVHDAHAAAAVSHPNIAALYEIGEDQGELFLAFEFVPGETLEAAIGGRPLNPRRAVDLAAQVADGLAEAHAAGIVHGALTADTIIVTPKGNAKILDVGLAAWTTRSVTPSQTATRTLGTPIDHRTDVFSLGVVLYEMLTGRWPFADAAPAGPGVQSGQAPSPSPATTNAVPGELEAIVSKALAKSPDQRYDSIATMAAELRTAASILDARSERSDPDAAARPALATRRRSFVGISVLLVLFAGVAAAAWWQRTAIDRAWRHATGPSPRPVIVVMPLTVGDADAAQTVFADGLADDLITRLGQTPGVTVVGRAALRRNRGRASRDVAHDVGAAVVLTGTMHRDHDDVTVALALSDPADDAAIWSSEYTRSLKDIFALQARAAEDITQALRLPLRLTAATARTSSRQVDRTAYELYLQGRQAAADGQSADAVKDYQAAIAADDALPEAFAGLARALPAAGAGGNSEDAARRERIRTAAERAYQLDPDLAAANVAMALASASLPQTLQYLKRAIDLDPSNGETYRDVSDVIRTVAPDLSAAFNRRAAELDPQTAGERVPVAAWRPIGVGRQRAAEAIARDGEAARRALAGVLDVRQ